MSWSADVPWSNTTIYTYFKDECCRRKSTGEDLNYNRCAIECKSDQSIKEWIQNYQTTNPKKPARHVLGFAMKAEKGLIWVINKKKISDDWRKRTIGEHREVCCLRFTPCMWTLGVFSYSQGSSFEILSQIQTQLQSVSATFKACDSQVVALLFG